jgi:hypothetical protein
MQGGGQSAQVTEDDLEQAEVSLLNKAEQKSQESLKNQIPANFVLLEDAIEGEALRKFSLSEAGQQKEQFDFTVSIKSRTTSFNEKEVESFAKQVLANQILESELIYEDSLNINYTPEIVDLDSGEVIVSLTFSAKVYPKVDVLLLKKELLGRSLNEAKSFLENQPGFVNSEIKFWPFWVKKVPQDLDKIKIQYPLIY